MMRYACEVMSDERGVSHQPVHVRYQPRDESQEGTKRIDHELIRV
jgi:hypothetical protein